MNARCQRWLSWFLVFSGIFLLALAAYAYFARPPGPALDVSQTDIEVSDCAAGQEREVVFRLQNNAGRPLRVLGLEEC